VNGLDWGDCMMGETLSHSDSKYNRPKGKMSVNYLRAMSSQLGCSLTEPGPGDDVNKLDATLTATFDTNPKWTFKTPRIEFQLKTTSNCVVPINGLIKYRLETKTLNMLRSGTNALLAVLFVSKEPNDWVRNTENGLLLEKRMLWYNPRFFTGNSDEATKLTSTIEIPEKNELTLRSLHKMIDMLGNGEKLPDVLPDEM
jgi:hypothetical protein